MPVYRRNADDEYVWHWSPECKGWRPDQLSTTSPPNLGTLCLECGRLDGDTYAVTISAKRRDVKNM